LNEITRNDEEGSGFACTKEENQSQILRYEGKEIWKDQILAKKFRNVYSETGIRSMVKFKNKEQWQMIGMYVTKREEIWERMIRKSESEV
jgi:hypothetical protein